MEPAISAWFDQIISNDGTKPSSSPLQDYNSMNIDSRHILDSSDLSSPQAHPHEFDCQRLAFQAVNPLKTLLSVYTIIIVWHNPPRDSELVSA